MEKEMGNVPSAGAKRGKLSFAARVSYGCGDTACNVVFGMISTLLTLFYTDYVGVAAAAVGMVMLISRVFDGFSDVVMGLLVERTNSRWGKSRPWILWMAVPYAVSAVLLFTVPHTTGLVQFLYIFVTYNFYHSLLYSYQSSVWQPFRYDDERVRGEGYAQHCAHGNVAIRPNSGGHLYYASCKAFWE